MAAIVRSRTPGEDGRQRVTHGGLCQRRVKATDDLDTSRSVNPAILSAAGAVKQAGGAQHPPHTSWPKPRLPLVQPRREQATDRRPGTRVDSAGESSTLSPVPGRLPLGVGCLATDVGSARLRFGEPAARGEPPHTHAQPVPARCTAEQASNLIKASLQSASSLAGLAVGRSSLRSAHHFANAMNAQLAVAPRLNRSENDAFALTCGG